MASPTDSDAATCPPWKSLQGKVVMVTGASSGIGKEICLDLARAGCRVVAAARRVDQLKVLCDEINGRDSVRAIGVWLDLNKEEGIIAEAVRRAWDSFGRIDALVNNAGIRDKVYSVLDWPEEKWNELMNTNLTGTWLVTKHVCRRMRDAKMKGSVINITTIAALDRGQLPGGAAYVASKTGVAGISKVMALELGEFGIRANSIAPGLFKSEITAGLVGKEWIQRVCERTTPLKTYGSVDPAITSLVRYLIHDSSGYVSGNNFIVDAGATLPGVPIFSSL
ncbi:NAD(P)-binding Rossmann-fold superfamily protein [Rhynchospora pubera]|uniref:NAD(P)-binding Rossmann-fold superfamily protein n=1 Tax=Rhynchospora pubera TaxID=906938 RepID=A0AAV8HIP1_9POAL|nr:NAD(P)-binding Rossmann-fold superfamily protein [Rhynchospora pubera]